MNLQLTKTICTSKIDPNYYVINGTNEIIIYYLKELFKENNEIKYQESMMEYFQNYGQEKIFVEKKSKLGKVLTRYIEQQKLIDTSTYIENYTLINAFINEIQKEESDEVYLRYLYQLIKNKEMGTIDELSSNYPKEVLEKIMINGVRQTYIKSLNSELTGFEEEGCLYVSKNNWYLFNIVTKVSTPLKKNKLCRKKK